MLREYKETSGSLGLRAFAGFLLGAGSYMRTSLVSHGNSPNTPRVAKAGDMSGHSLFCHSQILASLPSTCLRIERIEYIHRITQNKPLGKREHGERGKVFLAALEKGSEKKQHKNCFASNAARTHPHHSQLLPGCFLTPAIPQRALEFCSVLPKGASNLSLGRLQSTSSTSQSVTLTQLAWTLFATRESETSDFCHQNLDLRC